MAIVICPQCRKQVVKALLDNGDEIEIVRREGAHYVISAHKHPITQRHYNLARPYPGIYVRHECAGEDEVTTFGDTPAPEKIVAPKTLGDSA